MIKHFIGSWYNFFKKGRTNCSALILILRYNITLLPAGPVICLGGNHETKANAQMVYN